MKRLCCICARAGSKGVVDKNIRPLAGKPLIAHTIGQARDSRMFDVIAVSSDGERILECAREWEADLVVKRPAELAGDSSAKIPAIVHCAKEAEERTGTIFDIIADLAVTSPLRTVDDIRSALELLESSGAPNVLSAAPAADSPYFNIVERDEENRLHLSKQLDRPVLRRQDAPPCYALNGAVYVWTRQSLFAANEAVVREDSELYMMPPERSLDLDTEIDFQVAQALMEGGDSY